MLAGDRQYYKGREGDFPCWSAGGLEILNRGEQSDALFLSNSFRGCLELRVCRSLFVLVLELLPYVALSFAMK